MHIVSIKRSKRRNTWQAKDNDHNISHLQHFEHILKYILDDMDLDISRKDLFLKMLIDDKEFICDFHAKRKEVPKRYSKINLSYYYEVEDSRINEIVSLGFFLNDNIIDSFWKKAPEDIYVRIEESIAGEIIWK